MTINVRQEAIDGLRSIGQMFKRNPKRWTRNTIARDKNRKPCGVSSKGAFAFCAEGAMIHNIPASARALARMSLEAILPSQDVMNGALSRVVKWNDKQSRASTVGNKFLKAAKNLAATQDEYDGL